MIAEPGTMQPQTKKTLGIILVLLVLLGLFLLIFKDQFKGRVSNNPDLVSVRGQAIAGFPSELVPADDQGGAIENSYMADLKTTKHYVVNLNNDKGLQENFDYYKRFIADNGYEVTTSAIMPFNSGDTIQLAGISGKKVNSNVEIAIVYDINTKTSSINITYKPIEVKSTFEVINRAIAAEVNCVQGRYSTWPWGEDNAVYVDGVNITPGMRSGSYGWCDGDDGGGGGGGGGGTTDPYCSLVVIGSFNIDSIDYRSNMYATNTIYQVWSPSGGTYPGILDSGNKVHSDLPSGRSYWITVVDNLRGQTVNGYVSDFYDFDNSGPVYSAKSRDIAYCNSGTLDFVEVPYKSRPVIQAQ